MNSSSRAAALLFCPKSRGKIAKLQNRKIVRGKTRVCYLPAHNFAVLWFIRLFFTVEKILSLPHADAHLLQRGGDLLELRFQHRVFGFQFFDAGLLLLHCLFKRSPPHEGT